VTAAASSPNTAVAAIAADYGGYAVTFAVSQLSQVTDSVNGVPGAAGLGPASAVAPGREPQLELAGLVMDSEYARLLAGLVVPHGSREPRS
jgi:hypothetical protein